VTQGLWKHQQLGSDQLWASIEAGKKKICLTGATGSGKTKLAIHIIKEALRRDMKCVFHVNRKSLAEQTRKVFEANELHPGMRAASYDTDFDQPIQISMTPTEAARSLSVPPRWNVHQAGIVFIDEAHSEKALRIQKLIEKYKQQNSNVVIVGLTATPLDISHVYDDLIVAGINCGAHLHCKGFSPTMPDILKMKRKQNGEFKDNDVEKKMAPHLVFGHILPHHRKLNPLLKPALVFAPSVAASITITDMYNAAGIKAAHICGKSIYYGDKDSSGKPIILDSGKISLREKLFDQLRTGEIQVIVNKLVLEAGIDLPEVYHLVLATSFGSLTQFLQVGGRVVRNHSSLDHVILQDHGANCLIHGSLNNDREWELGATAKQLAEKTIKDRQEGKEQEPIVCPKCGAMRLSGPSCFECGHQHTQSGIKILQEDGILRELKGPYIKQKAKDNSAAVKNWMNLYFPCSKSKSPHAMTWNSMLNQYKMANPDIMVFHTNDAQGRKRLAAAERNGTVSFLPLHPPIGNDYLWAQKVRDVRKSELL
jgi:DNA repair protein RadD